MLHLYRLIDFLMNVDFESWRCAALTVLTNVYYALGGEIWWG